MQGWMRRSTVDVLGTEYRIVIKDYKDDEFFEKQEADGYCDYIAKEIAVCNLSSREEWDNEPQESRDEAEKATMRHELVHAFLEESGLRENSTSIEGAWATNEEMVDWFALQGPKVYAAWVNIGAVSEVVNYE